MALTSPEARRRRRAEAHGSTAGVHAELAAYLFNRRRFDEAIAALRAGVASVASPVEKAKLLTTLGRYVNTITSDKREPCSLADEAIALVETCGSADALITKATAQALLCECRWAEEPGPTNQLAESTLSLFDRVLRGAKPVSPADHFEACLLSARLNVLLGRLESAARWAGRALRKAPNRSEELHCLTELGAIHRDAGRLDEARKLLTEAVNAKGVTAFGRVRPYCELAWTEAKMGKLSDARTHARLGAEILQGDPKLPRWYLPELLGIEGDMAYQMGDTPEAMRSFLGAVEAYPSTAGPRWGSLLWLALCQFELGDVTSATRNAERVRASSHASTQQHNEALELLDAIRAKPKSR